MPKPRGRRDGDEMPVGLANQNSRPDIQVENSHAGSFQHARSVVNPAFSAAFAGSELLEGAVIKVEGVLLQCQRDEKPSARIPVWRRVKP